MTRDDVLKATLYTQHHIDRANAAVNAAARQKAEADSELNFAMQNRDCLIRAANRMRHEPLTSQEEAVISELVEYYLSDATA